MRTHHLTLGLTLLMFTGIVSYAEAKTRHLKCTQSNTFADGVETRIDTNGDNASATLSQGIGNCNGSNALVQEEAEWIQTAVTHCPHEPNMFEFYISETQGQQRAVGTDLKTGDQTFARITSGTLCVNAATGILSGTAEGIYIGGTGKNTDATGTFESHFSGRYLAFGCKDGICGGFGQSTATIEATLILPDGKRD
jgi:hypothetical protein